MRKMNRNRKRIFFGLLKGIIFLLAVGILIFGSYWLIIALVYAENPAYKNQVSIDTVQDNTGNKIAIIVGTATIVMAVLTMAQQHINRRQDRALAFPKITLKQCQFIIGQAAVSKYTMFYNNQKGDLLTKFLFEDTISPCYVPHIYRMAVAKHPYGETEREYTFLKIINEFSSFEKNEFCMEAVTDNADLLRDFCERQQGQYDDKLEIIMDVCWKNEFFMLGFRNMSSMHLRYRIRLDDTHREVVNNNELFGYCIENVNVKGAPLMKRSKGW